MGAQSALDIWSLTSNQTLLPGVALCSPPPCMCVQRGFEQRAAHVRRVCLDVQALSLLSAHSGFEGLHRVMFTVSAGTGQLDLQDLSQALAGICVVQTCRWLCVAEETHVIPTAAAGRVQDRLGQSAGTAVVCDTSSHVLSPFRFLAARGMSRADS